MTFPGTLLARWLVTLARTLAIGALAGAAAGWFVTRTYGAGALPAPWLYCTGLGVIYGLGLSATELGLARWLRAAAPLRSRKAVAFHVAVQAAGALAAFSVITVALHEIGRVEFPFPVLAFIGLLAVSIASVSHSVTSLTALHRRIQESEKSAAEAELRALRAQINPHFLFNSLNSIACYIRSRPAEAEAMTENLAELFRYSLRASILPAATLADEMESVEIYLAIERARFGERLEVSIDVPEELRRTEVPSLILQPLVENAIKHGMQQTLDRCRIEVRAQRDGDQVKIRVTDTGPGFSSTDLETALGKGTGLGNVRARLLHLFGDGSSLRILPQGVEIGFPLRLASGAADGPRPPAP